MNELTNLNELVKAIEVNCDPSLSFEYLTLSIFGDVSPNYLGGCGGRRTKHENIFKLLYPYLDEQVSFGTKKGGYSEYGFKRVIVDFYDRENKVAIEIDGKNHNSKKQQYKDKIKEAMLYIEYGVKTVRFTNNEVIDLLRRRIKTNSQEVKKC